MQVQRVYVIRSHSPNWIGLRAMLDREEGLALVGDTTRAAEAQVHAPALHPDFIISAIDLEGVSTVPLLTDLRAQLPEADIVLFAGQYDLQELRRLATLHIAGYFLWENLDHPAFAAALSAVMSRRFTVGCRTVADAFFNALGTADQATRLVRTLTDRQLAVLDLLAAGRTNESIARQLSIKTNTVATHVERLKKKLRVETRSECADLAIRAGLLR